MGYQGFSQKLELAKQVARAKAPKRGQLSEAQKVHRKERAAARSEKLKMENLAQRALIESRRR